VPATTDPTLTFGDFVSKLPEPIRSATYCAAVALDLGAVQDELPVLMNKHLEQFEKCMAEWRDYLLPCLEPKPVFE